MSVSNGRRFVGILGLSKYLNVMPPTIRKYVKKGLLVPHISEYRGKKQKVFDLQNIPFKPREGNYFRQREAAKFLHISVRTLMILKNGGIYNIKRLGWGIEGFSELDLMEFKEDFIKKAPVLYGKLGNEHISVRDIFRKKPLTVEIVLKVLDGILKDDLIPVGRVGDEIVDIIFTKQLISKLP